MLGTWFGRAFQELPEKAESNQTGVAFVGLLFGIAVGAGATGVSAPLIDFFNPMGEIVDGEPQVLFENRYATIMHYMVAFAISVSSFIGYYTSTNVPQLKIRFFNFPFAQFCLDISMVISYFTIFLFAEGAKDQPDARPEAWLVAISFVLYAIWDWLSWRLKKDPLSQLALGSCPCKDKGPWQTYKYRRKVTLCFGVVTLLLAVIVHSWEPSRTADVAIVDWILIALILMFRLLKSVGDSEIRYRGQPTGDQTPAPPRELCASDYRPLAKSDWRRVVPRSVFLELKFLKSVAKTGSLQLTPAEVAKGDAARRLEHDGAVKLRLSDDMAKTEVSLTCAGKAYVAVEAIATGT